MKITILLLAAMYFAGSAFGQGTTLFTFDGPPVVAPGTSTGATNYYEAGMSFTPIPGSRTFGRRAGSSTSSLWPDNGTAFVQAALGQSLAFSFTNGSTFDLISIDLAGYSSVVPDVTAQFVGYRADGSTVTVSVPRNGITFETYFFDSGFSDLTRVEVPDFGSLDNLVVSVPEPSALGLCLLGVACGFAKLRKRSNLTGP